MSRFQLEINNRGYLILSKELANQYFPQDACVAILKKQELWILPIYNANVGGLLLKRRNIIGDRSVLIHEILPENWKSGIVEAFWDAENVALRIAILNFN